MLEEVLNFAHLTRSQRITASASAQIQVKQRVITSNVNRAETEDSIG